MKIGGRVYRGRVLSREEIRPFAVIFAKPETEEYEQLTAEIRLWRIVYGRWWRRDVSRQILKLTPATLFRFREDFFAFLARIAREGPESQTNGRS